MSLIEVKNLSVSFETGDGTVNAVNEISFSLDRGRTLGIVGESGSGKSQSVLAMMGLLARNGRATGQVLYKGEDLIAATPSGLNRIRGDRLSIIFQDPMTSLNPYLTVERQMTEVLQFHKGLDRQAARARSVRMLDAVKIPDAARRIGTYPHEFSGGMRQRVMIAMALLCEPEVLIADEPTTALDVTVQAQILSLLRDLQRDFGTAIILITHDLGVVAGLCNQVMVLYGGRVMEQAAAEEIFYRPTHPYTVGLLGAIARLDRSDAPLLAIPGAPPNMSRPPGGCPFHPRCTLADLHCQAQLPVLAESAARPDVLRACHRNPGEVDALRPPAPTDVATSEAAHE
jgi:oligopeptide transport system ATP-binding protein